MVVFLVVCPIDFQEKMCFGNFFIVITKMFQYMIAWLLNCTLLQRFQPYLENLRSLQDTSISTHLLKISSK